MLQLYGSIADAATPEQGAANVGLYGVSTPAEVVARWAPAGVILINTNPQDSARPRLATRNIQTALQLKSLTTALRNLSGDQDLIIAIDQEGGRVNRLAPLVGKEPSAAAVGVSGATTAAAFERTAKLLTRLGINLDFAPVADVVPVDVPKASVIGDRAFGSDADLVSNRVATAVEALQTGHVAAVAKHWPGHGSTLIDSHLTAPVLDYSDPSFADRQIMPFGEAAQRGVAAIMVGHLAVPAWDSTGRVATISRPILDRLGHKYCGVIATDSLWMGGIRRYGSDEDLALDAVKAGVDLLVMPVDIDKASRNIATGADRDPGVRARLVDAATRVAILRSKYRSG